jgi:hypothetical protein
MRKASSSIFRASIDGLEQLISTEANVDVNHLGDIRCMLAFAQTGFDSHFFGHRFDTYS